MAISKLLAVKDIIRGLAGVIIDGEVDNFKLKELWICGFGGPDYTFKNPFHYKFKDEDGFYTGAQLKSMLKKTSKFSILFEEAQVHLSLNQLIQSRMENEYTSSGKIVFDTGDKILLEFEEFFGVKWTDMIRKTNNLPILMMNEASNDVRVRVESMAYLLSKFFMDPYFFSPFAVRIRGMFSI